MLIQIHYFGFLGTTGSLISWALDLISGFAQVLMGLIFQIRGLNIKDIFNSFGSGFGDMMNGIFLFGSISGNFYLSPYLLLCIIAGLISLVKISIDAVTGRGAGRKLWETLGLIIIAMIVIGMSLTGRSGNLAGSISNIVGEMEAQIIQTYKNDFGLFVTKGTGSSDKDIILTQNAMLSKAAIDQKILRQFGGYNVNELDLEPEDWGGIQIPEKYKNKIWVTVKNGGGSNYIKDLRYSNNLGYYLWASRSSVNTKTPYYTGNNGIIVVSANSTPYEVVDFLDYIYKEAKAKGLKDTEMKAERIIKSLNMVDKSVGILIAFLLAVEFIILFITSLRISVNILIAKVGSIMSMFMFPVAGPLFLIRNDKAQKFAKETLGLFVTSFARMTIFSIILDTIISMVIVVNSTGIPGIMTGIGLVILFNKFVIPRLADMVDNILSAYEPRYVREAVNKVKQFGKEKLANEYENRFGISSFRNYVQGANGELVENEGGRRIFKAEKDGINARIIAKGILTANPLGMFNELQAAGKIRKEGLKADAEVSQFTIHEIARLRYTISASRKAFKNGFYKDGQDNVYTMNGIEDGFDLKEIYKHPDLKAKYETLLAKKESFDNIVKGRLNQDLRNFNISTRDKHLVTKQLTEENRGVKPTTAQILERLRNTGKITVDDLSPQGLVAKKMIENSPELSKTRTNGENMLKEFKKSISERADNLALIENEGRLKALEERAKFTKDSQNRYKAESGKRSLDNEVFNDARIADIDDYRKQVDEAKVKMSIDMNSSIDDFKNNNKKAVETRSNKIKETLNNSSEKEKLIDKANEFVKDKDFKQDKSTLIEEKEKILEREKYETSEERFERLKKSGLEDNEFNRAQIDLSIEESKEYSKELESEIKDLKSQSDEEKE